MESYRVIYDALGHAVEITFPSGHVEIKRGFETEAAAEAWADIQRGMAASALVSRPTKEPT
ncbi:MAG TPA: hypothetical protein VN541_08190 [Tepidisphaeraceae bacterium]|nr:hypothetical protein [Tepidisphaeraceae bacterium]